MALESVDERKRVHTKYAPMTWRDLLLIAVGIVALVVASRFVDVPGFVYVGIVITSLGWEFTKFRLRRNADRFAGRP